MEVPRIIQATHVHTKMKMMAAMRLIIGGAFRFPPRPEILTRSISLCQVLCNVEYPIAVAVPFPPAYHVSRFRQFLASGCCRFCRSSLEVILMKRFSLLALLILAAPALLAAQMSAPASPVSDALRASLARSSKNMVAAAEAMPADKYDYKPTPQQNSF